jgi:hypothetical protein
MTREPIYEALFAVLSAIPNLVTTSRRLQHWSDVPAASQPALFQSQKKELQVPKKGFPAKVTLQCDIYLYVNTGNDLSVTPATTINPLMDAIEAALAPNPATGVQTLGGTVSHCWIEGEIMSDEGVLGPQGVLIIPVFILANT